MARDGPTDASGGRNALLLAPADPRVPTHPGEGNAAGPDGLDDPLLGLAEPVTGLFRGAAAEILLGLPGGDELVELFHGGSEALEAIVLRERHALFVENVGSRLKQRRARGQACPASSAAFTVSWPGRPGRPTAGGRWRRSR